MDKDYLKEKIVHHRNIKDNLLAASIVTIGGTLSVALNPDNIFEIILICIGVLWSCIFINAYFTRYAAIRDLISKLNKGE